MKTIIFTSLFAVLFLVGAGCISQDEDFPKLNKEVEPFDKAYFVCENPDTGERIYKYSFYGDDSGWESFFDQDGKLLEETPEMGPGAGPNGADYQPKTKVKKCIRTTEAYFESQIVIE